MTPEFQLLLDELRLLRADVRDRMDRHEDDDREVHTELRGAIARWKGAAAALATAWGALTAAATLWIAYRGMP